jgi:hypothetical protein
VHQRRAGDIALFDRHEMNKSSGQMVRRLIERKAAEWNVAM